MRVCILFIFLILTVLTLWPWKIRLRLVIDLTVFIRSRREHIITLPVSCLVLRKNQILIYISFQIRSFQRSIARSLRCIIFTEWSRYPTNLLNLIILEQKISLAKDSKLFLKTAFLFMGTIVYGLW